jgi:hypothetical protein
MSKGVRGLASMPSKPTDRGWAQCFRVWTARPTGRDWGPEWECVATFGFLRDCLDYIAGLQDGGVDCAFQSPTGVQHIRATDQRVVWKPKPETAVA